MEGDAPIGWTTLVFPLSYTTRWIISDSTVNIWQQSNAACTGYPYTINTGRSTNSYFLYWVNGTVADYFHINAIVIGY